MRKSLIASVLLHGSAAALAAVAIGWGESGEREAVRVQFQVSLSAPPSDLVPLPPLPPESLPTDPVEFDPQEIEIEMEDVDLPPVEFERVPPRRTPIAAPLAISNKRLSKPLRVSKPPVPELKPVEPQKSPAPPAPPAAQVDAPPVPQSCQPPAYPALARRLGHEGTVKVRLKIDAAGAVTRAHVQESSGSKLLDLAALQAARSWTFRPASRGGRLVAEEVIQPVIFRLN